MFAKAKPKTGRKLDWSCFKNALTYLSERRFAKTWKEQGPQAALEKVYQAIANAGGPQAHATKVTKWIS